MTDRLPKAIDSVFLSPVTDRARNSPQGYDWKQTPERTNPKAREKGRETGKKKHAQALHIQKPQLLSVSLFSTSQHVLVKPAKWRNVFGFCFLVFPCRKSDVNAKWTRLLPTLPRPSPCPWSRRDGCLSPACAWGCCSCTIRTFAVPSPLSSLDSLDLFSFSFFFF